MSLVLCLALKPRSLNARPSEDYRAAIAAAAQAKHQEALLDGPLYSRIIWFHKVASAQGDIDNIAKRIHDALKTVVFADDEVITHTIAIKVNTVSDVEIAEESGSAEAFLELSERLADPAASDVLYIEVGRQQSKRIRLGPVD